jgi:uncharacterized membrane protein
VIPLAIALGSVVWLVVLIATPLAPASLATLIYAAGSVVCHQIPERSFHLAGFQLPVCARCLGIYAGAAAAASIHGLGVLVTDSRRWRSLSPRAARNVFLVSALPTLVTVGLEWGGVWRGTNGVRAIAGIALGVGGGLVVMGAAATLHYNACQRRRPIGPSQMPPPI